MYFESYNLDHIENLPVNVGFQVHQLRKEGKLKEAYLLAKENLDNETQSQGVKRALSWVLYEYLKASISDNNITKSLKILNEVNELNLPSDEKMFFESVAWKIGKIIFDLKKQEPINWTTIDQIFYAIRNFSFSKPSESYSFLLKAFQKSYDYWKNYVDFIEWWGLGNLMPHDFLPTELDNGKKIMPLAEQVQIAYSKKIIEYDNISPEKIEHVLNFTNEIIIKHPEYKYANYYKAQLLLTLDKKAESLNYFEEFARKNHQSFWVWSVFSDYFSENQKKIACLVKAVSCTTPQKFLVKVREKLIQLLILEKHYQIAKKELDILIKTRVDEGWPIYEKYREWSNKIEEGKQTNVISQAFYSKNIKMAEELLYASTPIQMAIIDFVDKKKKVASFITKSGEYGKIKYSFFIKHLKEAEIIQLRLGEKRKFDFFQVYTLNKVNESPPEFFFKTVSGLFKKSKNGEYGFVKDVFVQSTFVTTYNLKDGNNIKIRARLGYDLKKETSTWKAIELITQSEEF